jgi:hypothetical protein
VGFSLLLLLALQFMGCQRQTPEALFREAVTNAIPPSVQIVDATRKSRSGSIEIWLHFKGSKQDLATILKSEQFRDLGESQLNYSAYSPPAWWTPEKLGAGRKWLDCETSPHFRRDHSAKDIVVSERQDEAYFLLRSWYNY